MPKPLNKASKTINNIFLIMTRHLFILNNVEVVEEMRFTGVEERLTVLVKRGSSNIMSTIMRMLTRKE